MSEEKSSVDAAAARRREDRSTWSQQTWKHSSQVLGILKLTNPPKSPRERILASGESVILAKFTTETLVFPPHLAPGPGRPFSFAHQQAGLVRMSADPSPPDWSFCLWRHSIGKPIKYKRPSDSSGQRYEHRFSAVTKSLINLLSKTYLSSGNLSINRSQTPFFTLWFKELSSCALSISIPHAVEGGIPMWGWRWLEFEWLQKWRLFFTYHHMVDHREDRRFRNGRQFPEEKFRRVCFCFTHKQQLWHL